MSIFMLGMREGGLPAAEARMRLAARWGKWPRASGKQRGAIPGIQRGVIELWLNFFL